MNLLIGKYIRKLIQYKKIFYDILNEKVGVFTLKIFSFFLTLFLARYLGPKGYGIYTISLSIAFLLSGILDLGIPVAILRYFPNIKDKEKRDYLFSFLLKLQIIVNVISIILLFFLVRKFAEIFFKDPRYQVFAFISIILSFLITIKKTFVSVFQSYRKFDIIRNINIFEGSSKLFFIILLSILLGVLGSVIGFTLSYLFLIFILLLYLRKFNISFKSGFISNKLEIFKYLLLVNLSTISKSAYQWVNSIIISILLNFWAVGLYRAADSLIGVLIMFSGLHSIFAPRISKWDIPTIKKNLPKIFLLNLLISIPFLVFLFIFGKEVLAILFGEEYVEAFELLKILSFLIILGSISYFILIFDLKGKPEYSMLTMSIRIISNVILSYLLIMNLGFIGVAWAIIISWIISLIFAYILFELKFK